MTEMQDEILQAVAALADSFRCVRSVAIFGSVGRGDTRCARDIDLAFEFVEPLADHVDDYTAFQQRLESWACEIGARFGLSVSSHNAAYPFDDEIARNAVGGGVVLARRGKASLVATAPKPG